MLIAVYNRLDRVGSHLWKTKASLFEDLLETSPAKWPEFIIIVDGPNCAMFVVTYTIDGLELVQRPVEQE